MISQARNTASRNGSGRILTSFRVSPLGRKFASNCPMHSSTDAEEFLLRGGINPPSVLFYVYTSGGINPPSVKYTTFREGELPKTPPPRGGNRIVRSLRGKGGSHHLSAARPPWQTQSKTLSRHHLFAARLLRCRMEGCMLAMTMASVQAS